MNELTDFMTLIEDEHTACNRLRKICVEIEKVQDKLQELRTKFNPTAATIDVIDRTEAELIGLCVQQEAARRMLEEARKRMRDYLRNTMDID